ncbi:mannosyl-oligosaccharide alpha-1,2-mannosidase, glycoside hydrolase family 47 protein [Pseudohyphozyma bogoriensis]|nr:mannosyl-oligosaccharide alpha-1,2-mannosidase, glycoside hydrolase family 47 protein [Pseudohyphozyma bogoriensis]
MVTAELLSGTKAGCGDELKLLLRAYSTPSSSRPAFVVPTPTSHAHHPPPPEPAHKPQPFIPRPLSRAAQVKALSKATDSSTTIHLTSAASPEFSITLPNLFLRDSSAHPSHLHPASQQKLFRTTDIPLDGQLIGYGVHEVGGEDCLVTEWNKAVEGVDKKTAKLSVVPVSVIQKLVERNSVGALPRFRTWAKQELGEGPHEAQYLEFMVSTNALYETLTPLLETGIVLVRGVPTKEKAGHFTELRKLVERIGSLRRTWYGDLWDVKAEEGSKNIAYTNLDLGLHMDLTHFERPPRYQFLHSLLNASITGGSSYFVDSFHIASLIRTLNPSAYHALTTTPVLFEYKNGGKHTRWARPTIELAPTGEIWAVNYSPPFQGPLLLSLESAADELRLKELHEALSLFAELAAKEENTYRVQLEPGDCVVFDNRRVLHARTAFEFIITSRTNIHQPGIPAASARPMASQSPSTGTRASTSPVKPQTMATPPPRRNGRQTQDINHLLGFTLPPRAPPPPSGPRRSAKKHTTVYDKARYLAATFRFIVNPTSDYTAFFADPDLHFAWEDILQVIVDTSSALSSASTSTIDQPVEQSGHDFDRLHYLALSEGQRYRKCPVCWDAVYPKDLKPVHFHSPSLVSSPNTPPSPLPSLSEEGSHPAKHRHHAGATDSHHTLPTEPLKMRLVRRPQITTLALPRSSTWPSEAVPPLRAPWQFTPDALSYAKFMLGAPEYIKEELEINLRDLQKEIVELRKWGLRGGTDEELGIEFVKVAIEKVEEAIRGTEALKTSTVMTARKRALRELQEIKNAKGKDAVPPLPLVSETSSSEVEEDSSAASVALKKLSLSSNAPPLIPSSTTGFGRPQKKNDVIPQTSTDVDSAYLFYQAATGQNIFLQPLDIRILKSHFGTYEAMPDTLEVLVEGQDEGTADVVFVETDLSRVVSKASLEPYATALKQRRNKRRDKAKREDKAKLKSELKEMESRPAYASQQHYNGVYDYPNFPPPASTFSQSLEPAAFPATIPAEPVGEADPAAANSGRTTVWGTKSFASSLRPDSSRGRYEEEDLEFDDRWHEFEENLSRGGGRRANSGGASTGSNSGGGSGDVQIRAGKKKGKKLRVLRVLGLGYAAYTLYPKLFPKALEEIEVVGSAKDLKMNFEPIALDAERRNAVLEAFKHSYGAYERDAFGFDDYHPISHTGSNMSPAGPVGYFIVDSLDSLLVMGLKDEYERARAWVKDLSFDLDDKYHNFEITIRVLGGLLSAYHLSDGDPLFLEKAVDLADRLMPVFDTPSGIPLSFVNLKKREGIADADNRGLSSVAEAATLQLELKYLSELTGNPIYWKKAEHVMDIIRDQEKKDGLVPIFLSPANGKFFFSDIRLGSRGDSYYEYLIKQYLQTNRTEEVYKEMHDEAMGGVKEHLLKNSPIKGLFYTSELLPRRDRTGGMSLEDTPKQDHLVCFLGGSLLLGVTEGYGPLPPDRASFSEDESDDFIAGVGLIKGCMDTYQQTKTGLAPEIVNFYRTVEEARKAGREWFINSRAMAAPNPPIDARNILRPETVESLFIAYRITGDPIYRTWGWEIFRSFEKYAKLPGGGFASILDVDEVPVKYEDKMETFWISETLKYLYLLFSEPELVPLDKYVFNTEAHILPVFTRTVVV